MIGRFLCFLALLGTVTIPVNVTAQQQDSLRLQELRLELQRAQDQNLEDIRRELRSTISAELIGHRQYLQELNDRFYERLAFWLPVASVAVTVLFAHFLWQVGKTRKEAFDSARATAVATAEALAKEKVNSIVVPAEVIAEAQKLARDAATQMSALKDSLIRELTAELTAARDEVVENKQAVILQALDEAMKDSFAKELDLMGRVEALERSLALAKREQDVYNRAVMEAVSDRSDSAMLEVALPGVFRVQASVVESVSRALMRFFVR